METLLLDLIGQLQILFDGTAIDPESAVDMLLDAAERKISQQRSIDRQPFFTKPRDPLSDARANSISETSDENTKQRQ